MKLLPSPDYFRNNVAFRNDTILGVCEALGHDLGLNPNFLRVPLAAGIMFSPLLMLGIYLALGGVVFVSRTFFPDKVERVAAAERAAQTPTADNETVELQQAA